MYQILVIGEKRLIHDQILLHIVTIYTYLYMCVVAHHVFGIILSNFTHIHTLQIGCDFQHKIKLSYTHRLHEIFSKYIQILFKRKEYTIFFTGFSQMGTLSSWRVQQGVFFCKIFVCHLTAHGLSRAKLKKITWVKVYNITGWDAHIVCDHIDFKVITIFTTFFPLILISNKQRKNIYKQIYNIYKQIYNVIERLSLYQSYSRDIEIEEREMIVGCSQKLAYYVSSIMYVYIYIRVYIYIHTYVRTLLLTFLIFFYFFLCRLLICITMWALMQFDRLFF
eukprot:TRINITY_DN34651_c0_g1_i1.p1 TRINITY_DN34651_c0_g1~~TRINITY_DN34651_c0_g1_i1.p1  ORF type:complete len:290 (-),score=-33.69 TRINITY_DN34651_c0_g1_i1:204-1040(-)